MTLANRALWRKTFAEAAFLLAPIAATLVAFAWLNVYITNRLEVARIPELVKLVVPTDMLQLNSMNLSDWGTRKGLMSALFIHPLVEAAFLVWALARGSAAVSGELSRGTMEMLLAQPISRRALLLANIVTTLLGCLVLAAATVFGLWLGLATAPKKPPAVPPPLTPAAGMLKLAESAAAWAGGIGLGKPAAPPAAEEIVRARSFIPAAAIIFAYSTALAALTTMVSAFTTFRYRTLGIIGLFGVVQVGMDVVWRWLGKDQPLFAWLKYGTLKAAFEPQLVMFAEPAAQAGLLFKFMSVYAVVAGLAYLVAFWGFARRDLPAPM